MDSARRILVEVDANAADLQRACLKAAESLKSLAAEAAKAAKTSVDQDGKVVQSNKAVATSYEETAGAARGSANAAAEGAAKTSAAQKKVQEGAQQTAQVSTESAARQAESQQAVQQEMTRTATVATAAVEKQTTAQRALQAEMEKSAAAVTRAAAQQVQAIQDAMAASVAAVERQIVAQQALQVELEKSAAVAARLAAEQVKVSQGVAAASAASAASVERAVKRTETAFGTSGAMLTRWGRNTALAIGGAAAATAWLGVRFEQETTKMRTQAGISAAQLKQLQDGILKMAPSVGAMPQHLAEGMYHVVSSMDAVLPKSQRVSDELVILREAAKGAAIGGSNLEQTAYVLSSAMNALHERGTGASKTMAELNAIVGTGDMRMQDLMAAMSTGIVPAAENFGVSLRSIGAALAVMVDRGTPAQLAATRLRMSMSLLGAPAKQSAKMLEALGMSSDDARARTQAMTDALAEAGLKTTTLSSDLRKPDGIAVALKDLNDHLKASGLSAEGAGAVISRAFGGGRSGAAIMELVKNVDMLRVKFDQQGKVVKEYGRDWQGTQHTLAFEVKQLESDVVSLGTKLGLALIPEIEKGIQDGKDLYHWFDQNKLALHALEAVVIGGAGLAISSWFISLGRKAAEAAREVVGLAKVLMSVPGRLETMIAGTPAPVKVASGETSSVLRDGMVGGARSGFGLPGSQANPLVVMAVGGLGAAGGASRLGGVTSVAEGETVSRGGVILPAGVGAGAGVAAAETERELSNMSAGFITSLRSGLGKLVGNLTRGIGIAGAGVIGSQLVGGAIGGHTGHVVSGIGTGAAIGAGLGSMIGPIGTLGGAAIGGSIAGIQKILDGEISTTKASALQPLIDDANKALQSGVISKVRKDIEGLRIGMSEMAPKDAKPVEAYVAKVEKYLSSSAGHFEQWAQQFGVAGHQVVTSFQDIDTSSAIVPQVNDLVARNMASIAANLDLQSAAGRKAIEANLGSAIHAVETYMQEGLLSANKGGTEIAHLLRLSFNSVRQNAQQIFPDTERIVAMNMDVIRHTLGTTSRAGAAALVANYADAEDGIRAAMAAGVISTQKGIEEINKLMVQALRTLGVSTGDLKLLNGTNFSADDLKAISGSSYALGQTNQATNHRGIATGGYIGSPGEKGRDNVHVVLGRGEAVLNGPQQQAIAPALSFAKAAGVSRYGSLGEVFSGETKKHYMASGGFAGQPSASHMAKLLAAANRVSGANFPYHLGGGHEQPSRFEPFDCSGAVSYAVQQAGYRVPTVTSGEMGSWGFPAGPGGVTVFFNPVHTFMRIGSRYWGTSGFARPGGGAGWFTQEPGANYLAGFQTIHLPDLGSSADFGGIAVPQITGSSSPIASIANAALKRTAAAASAYVVRQAAAATGAAGAGGGGQALADGNGRVFRGPVSTFGPPTEAAGGTAYGHSSAEPGIAIDPTPPGGWNSALARSLAGHIFHVTVGSHSADLPVIDKGPAAGPRVIDITGAGAQMMGLNPLRFPTDSIGTAVLADSGGVASKHARGGFVAMATGGTAGGIGVTAKAPASSATKGIVSRVRAQLASHPKSKKVKPAPKHKETLLARALAPFKVIPDVNHLPGNVDKIKVQIQALNDLGTLLSGVGTYTVLPGDMQYLTPTLQAGEVITPGMTLAAAQRVQQAFANKTAGNDLLDLQGQILDWVSQQADHQLLTAGDIAIMHDTFKPSGVALAAGMSVPVAKRAEMNARIVQMFRKVAIEQQAQATIDSAVTEREARRKIVDALMHTEKRRLDKLNKDVQRLTIGSAADRVRAAKDSAARGDRVRGAQDESAHYQDLIDQERAKKLPNHSAILGWEKKKRDLASYVRSERSMGSRSVGEAEVALTKQLLHAERGPLEDALHALGGNKTQIGKSGMFGRIISDIKTLRQGRATFSSDIAQTLQQDLPQARIALRDVLQSLSGSVVPTLSPAGSAQADNSQLLSLVQQENQTLAHSLALSQAQFAVFQDFLPQIPAYEHGGLVANTGLALVHEGEWVSPAPKGPYGSQIVAAGTPSSNGPHHVEVNIHGAPEEFVKMIDARINGTAATVVSRQLGRRARMLASAPGGRRSF